MVQSDVQAVGKEGDEDVGFDTIFELMEDGAHGQVALEIFEGLFNLGQQRVKAPEQGGVVFAKVAAQQITAFATAGIAELFAVKAEAKAGGFFRF